jgi:uncharacterized protein DUF935
MARRARLPLDKLETPSPKPIIGEIGWAGVNPFGIFAQEEAYDYFNVAIADLERMVQQDGQAQSLYRILTMPLRASETNLKPATNGQAEYDFIKRQLFGKPQEGGMTIPWKRVIASLARSVLTGAEVLEKVYKIGKINGQELILLDKLAPRPRRTLRFRMDPKGNFDGVIQMIPMQGQQTIEKDKCLHFVVNGEMNPVFGCSFLLPAYYHYKSKHKLYYVGHLGFALAAVALKKLHIPPEADPIDRHRFEQAAAQMGVNTTITIPEGYELELEYGSRVPAEMIPFVDHHDDQMAKAVLAQILNLGTSGNTGSYALSEAHLDLVFVVIESIMDDVSYEFNTSIIPNLVDWNFGTSNYPTLEVAPSYTDRREVVKDIFRHISGARQTNVTPDFLLELEKAMAEQLGFSDNIDYDTKQESMLKDAKKRQDAQTGVKKPAVPPFQPQQPQQRPQQPQPAGRKP